MDGRDGGRRSGELAVPFVFVPHGEEPPAAWLAEHPGAVRFPGRLVLRSDGETGMGALAGAPAYNRNATSMRDKYDDLRRQRAQPKSSSTSMEAAPPSPASFARASSSAGSGAVTRQTIRSGNGYGRASNQPPTPGDYAARLAAGIAVERPEIDVTQADLANTTLLSELQQLRKDEFATQVSETDVAPTTTK